MKMFVVLNKTILSSDKKNIFWKKRVIIVFHLTRRLPPPGIDGSPRGLDGFLKHVDFYRTYV